tara:strand:- start:9215 stop:9337 length:123 start_codon:yes stop_codon:yes gene_type:complete
MAQTIIDFDENEEEVITKYKKKWDMSKARTVRKLVLEFKE